MTDILNVPGFIVKDYGFIEEVGIVLSLEKIVMTVRCPHCGSSTDKLHQNNPLTIRDIFWGEQQIYLRVNRRVMRCDRCGTKFREELGFVKQKRNHTERFKTKIIQEVIESDLKNVAQRNDVSEQEIETQKDKLKEVKKVSPILAKMHCLKEEFREIFDTNFNWVEGLFSLGDWLRDAKEYFPKSFGTIRRWLGEIIAYFDYRTTQGIVEGINNKLKLIKRRGYGFRNFDQKFKSKNTMCFF